MMIVFQKKTLSLLPYIVLALLAVAACHNPKTTNELEAISLVADEIPIRRCAC